MSSTSDCFDTQWYFPGLYPAFLWTGLWFWGTKPIAAASACEFLSGLRLWAGCSTLRCASSALFCFLLSRTCECGTIGSG
eukprot:1866934-Rhodomonas_salina.1